MGSFSAGAGSKIEEKIGCGVDNGEEKSSIGARSIFIVVNNLKFANSR